MNPRSSISYVPSIAELYTLRLSSGISGDVGKPPISEAKLRSRRTRRCLKSVRDTKRSKPSSSLD